jgi:hypothetical protein
MQNYLYKDRKLRPNNYFYKLKQIDFDGTFEYSEIVEVELHPLLEFYLEQNYPNPFNPTTNIEFRIAKHGFVILKLFDVIGNEIATIVNEEKPAGTYEVEFSAIGGSASGGDADKLPSGIYFYQLKVGSFVETKKMILLK